MLEILGLEEGTSSCVGSEIQNSLSWGLESSFDLSIGFGVEAKAFGVGVSSSVEMSVGVSKSSGGEKSFGTSTEDCAEASSSVDYSFSCPPCSLCEAYTEGKKFFVKDARKLVEIQATYQFYPGLDAIQREDGNWTVSTEFEVEITGGTLVQSSVAALAVTGEAECPADTSATSARYLRGTGTH